MDQPQTSLNEQFAPEIISVGLPWRLLIFSIFIFVAVIFSYFGLKYGYKNYLEDSKTQLDENLEGLSSQVKVEDRNRFVDIYSKVANLKAVLEKHPFGANAFKFLEKKVLPTVYFNDFSLSPVNKSLILKGYASDFDSLSSQMGIFDESSEVIKATLDEVNLQGGINFSLTLLFNPEFLSKPI